MEADITIPTAEYLGQPYDERPRGLSRIENSSPAELAEALHYLTGLDPLHETD